MKKIFALLLAIVMLFSLSACNNNKTKITPEEVSSMLESFDGTLEMEMSGDYVSSFTYTMEFVILSNDATVDELKDNYREKFYDMMSGKNSGDFNYSDISICSAIICLISIDTLVYDESKHEGEYYLDEFLENSLDVIFNSKTLNDGGWTISAEIDEDNREITYFVK